MFYLCLSLFSCFYGRKLAQNFGTLLKVVWKISSWCDMWTRYINSKWMKVERDLAFVKFERDVLHSETG